HNLVGIEIAVEDVAIGEGRLISGRIDCGQYPGANIGAVLECVAVHIAASPRLLAALCRDVEGQSSTHAPGSVAFELHGWPGSGRLNPDGGAAAASVIGALLGL